MLRLDSDIYSNKTIYNFEINRDWADFYCQTIFNMSEITITQISLIITMNCGYSSNRKIIQSYHELESIQKHQPVLTCSFKCDTADYLLSVVVDFHLSILRIVTNNSDIMSLIYNKLEEAEVNAPPIEEQPTDETNSNDIISDTNITNPFSYY